MRAPESTSVPRPDLVTASAVAADGFSMREEMVSALPACGFCCEIINSPPDEVSTPPAIVESFAPTAGVTRMPPPSAAPPVMLRYAVAPTFTVEFVAPLKRTVFALAAPVPAIVLVKPATSSVTLSAASHVATSFFVGVVAAMTLFDASFAAKNVPVAFASVIQLPSVVATPTFTTPVPAPWRFSSIVLCAPRVIVVAVVLVPRLKVSEPLGTFSVSAELVFAVSVVPE